ncbi:hypothetical protein CPB86DRAFT_792201 [Serendipita vermifera]|nr:hypothetical protein CPB86DRAFT_792201 [Serendipita vermifera]
MHAPNNAKLDRRMTHYHHQYMNHFEENMPIYGLCRQGTAEMKGVHVHWGGVDWTGS